MDIFKLAFETMIVGLLAFAWLGVATYLLFPDFLTDFLSRAPSLAKEYQTLMGVGVLTIAYCLGSAILPISSQLVNDEHWPLNETAIRCEVFTKQQQAMDGIRYTTVSQSVLPQDPNCSYWGPIFEKNIEATTRVSRFVLLWAGFSVTTSDHSNEEKKETRKPIDTILAAFRQQETTILNQGPDKTERLRQLYERIVVLRGAVFSGFILFLISLFVYIAPAHGDPSRWQKTAPGLVALTFLTFAATNGGCDLVKRDIFDVPVLESLLIVITIFGLFLAAKGVKIRPFIRKRLLLVVAFFAALAYCGWMSSEIIYDQEIISSAAVPQAAAVPLSAAVVPPSQ